jgi:hypothetical protein
MLAYYEFADRYNSQPLMNAMYQAFVRASSEGR